jgi:uncharacterized protein
MSRAIEVIVKISERCNIACSYCYFFYGSDTSYLQHPARISYEIIDQLGSYLAEGATALGLDKVCIDFHGGEPLLVGKAKFSAFCDSLRLSLEPQVEVELRCQTNGMLIDSEWIDVFAKHRVHIGLSLDGPAEYHDQHRRGFDGKATYTQVVRGLSFLRAAVADSTLDSFGVLCVIQPDRSARTIYRHFVDDLGIRMMDFLLPDNTHDSTDAFDVAGYGVFLRDLLAAWAEDADMGVRVRILESVFALLVGGESRMMGFRRNNHHVITVSSSGTIGPDDTLRSCGSEFMATGFDIRTSRLSDYLSSAPHRNAECAMVTLPNACSECAWQGICGGGALVNRFRSTNGFNNPSVYCSALKDLYVSTARYLMHCGITEGELVDAVIGV